MGFHTILGILGIVFHMSPDDMWNRPSKAIRRTTTTATTTVVPLAPFVEAQGLTKVPGVSFALHGTLFVRPPQRPPKVL
jgi:hypothetical protein